MINGLNQVVALGVPVKELTSIFLNNFLLSLTNTLIEKIIKGMVFVSNADISLIVINF